MKRWLQLSFQGVRGLLAGVASFLVWTLWLALVLLLAAQLYIVSANELTLPDFVLRRVEAKLAESGLRATFGRTSFDPAGRILVENPRLYLPAFAEPIVTASSVYVRLNPWMLVVGQVEPREIRITDAVAAVPVMLSPSGQQEPFVQEFDATLLPENRTLTLQQLSGRIAGVTVSARGTVLLARRTAAPETDIGALLARHFATICRQALLVREYAQKFEQPRLHLDLAPSESGAALITATALARAGQVTGPQPVQGTDLRATTRLLLLGDTPASWVEFTAGELVLPNKLRLRGVHANVYGRFGRSGLEFEPREIEVTADAVSAAGVSAEALSAQIFPRPLPRLDVQAVGTVLGEPLAVRGSTDVKVGDARVAFTGRLSPTVLDVLSQRLRVPVQKFFDFTELQVDQAEARFAPGWAFEKLDAQVRVEGVNAYGVKMTNGVVTLELDPHRFHAPHAFARVGENFARGSYEQDLKTLEYRFLLAGRLRPLDISEWFRDWWPNFFRQLEFPEIPPAASVDVRGSWRNGQRTSVFVFADAPHPVIRGTAFDRVRTRLFIRPGFFDGLELFGTRPEGAVRGRFAYLADTEGDGWTSFDLAFDSSLDLAIAPKLLGPGIQSVLEPFQVSAPPALNLSGRFTGPSAPEGSHRILRIQARTTGPFQFHKFPLQDVSFVAQVQDDDIVIEELEAMFAGGVAGGRAQVTGLGEQRRLGFDIALSDASLGQVAAELQGFFARQKGETPPPPGKFVQEKANVRLDFAASGEGRYDDPFSFRGDGNATLEGAELGEVPLLGKLSELLKFTALRFTNAQTNLKIEGPKLVFTDVKLLGSNAAIEAYGNYALDRRELDFHAKIFPFQESENIIKTVVGAVLTPLSNAFEVKLSGSLEKPEWAFVIGPTNLLRSLTPGETPEKTEGKPAEPPAAPKAEPTPSS